MLYGLQAPYLRWMLFGRYDVQEGSQCVRLDFRVVSAISFFCTMYLAPGSALPLMTPPFTVWES